MVQIWIMDNYTVCINIYIYTYISKGVIYRQMPGLFPEPQPRQATHHHHHHHHHHHLLHLHHHHR